MSNVETVEGGCIVSLYSTGSHGYSQIGWHEHGRRVMGLGHRIAWEARRGPIPEDLTIDHKCHNRRCINVDHLRLLTLAENSAEPQRRKTHCPHGHPYDGPNLGLTNLGHRFCKTCRALYKANLYQRQKASAE